MFVESLRLNLRLSARNELFDCERFFNPRQRWMWLVEFLDSSSLHESILEKTFLIVFKKTWFYHIDSANGNYIILMLWRGWEPGSPQWISRLPLIALRDCAIQPFLWYGTLGCFVYNFCAEPRKYRLVEAKQ